MTPQPPDAMTGPAGVADYPTRQTVFGWFNCTSERQVLLIKGSLHDVFKTAR